MPYQAKQQQWHRVAEHPCSYRLVKSVRESLEFFSESCKYGCGAEQVGKEYQPDSVVEVNVGLLKGREASEKTGHYQEYEQVQQNIRYDECELQEHKLDGLALLSESAEHYCLEGIH